VKRRRGALSGSSLRNVRRSRPAARYGLTHARLRYPARRECAARHALRDANAQPTYICRVAPPRFSPLLTLPPPPRQVAYYWCVHSGPLNCGPDRHTVEKHLLEAHKDDKYEEKREDEKK
jgi:hypothetical protein